MYYKHDLDYIDPDRCDQPLFPDKALSPMEATRQLQKQAYHAVQILCGIQPGDPQYRTEQDPANYQKTM